MKKAYTPKMIIDIIKLLDTRALKFSEDKLNTVIDDAYAELCTIIQAFSDEEVVDLTPFYTEGEELVTLDINEDVVDIYDLYVTFEDKDKEVYKHGIEKIRDDRVIYKDNRYNGRVHIDLEVRAVKQYDNAVLKYYYIPTHTTETVYMDAQTWIAFKSSLGVVVYAMLHDVTKSGQKRAEMTRRARAIVPDLPEDGNDPSYGHIFYGVEH